MSCAGPIPTMEDMTPTQRIEKPSSYMVNILQEKVQQNGSNFGRNDAEVAAHAYLRHNSAADAAFEQLATMRAQRAKEAASAEGLDLLQSVSNATGFLGVTRSSGSGKFQAWLSDGTALHHAGGTQPHFITPEEAALALARFYRRKPVRGVPGPSREDNVCIDDAPWRVHATALGQRYPASSAALSSSSLPPAEPSVSLLLAGAPDSPPPVAASSGGYIMAVAALPEPAAALATVGTWSAAVAWPELGPGWQHQSRTRRNPCNRSKKVDVRFIASDGKRFKTLKRAAEYAETMTKGLEQATEAPDAGEAPEALGRAEPGAPPMHAPVAVFRGGFSSKRSALPSSGCAPAPKPKRPASSAALAVPQRSWLPACYHRLPREKPSWLPPCYRRLPRTTAAELLAAANVLIQAHRQHVEEVQQREKARGRKVRVLFLEARAMSSDDDDGRAVPAWRAMPT